MANVVIDKNKIDILANAIADKSGEPVTMTLDEMVSAVDGIQTGGGITPTGNIDITQAGVTDVTDYATVTVPSAYFSLGNAQDYYTENGQRKFRYEAILSVNPEEGGETKGWLDEGTYESGYIIRNAIPKNTTVTPTTSAQTIGGANYMMEGAVTVSAMPTGTAGTPTATKGTVSNHSVTVTPSVTNTTGYITGSTKTGTAVTVSASELVSGSETKTANGTYDVTNLASLVVNVSGGGSSKNVQIAQGVDRVATTSYTAVSGQSITVSKTGTYDVYWVGFRSSTGGTNGSQLYIGSTAYGTAQTTFTNHGQSIHLSNVSLTQGQTVTVRARARGTNYYMYVGNLTIKEA